MASELNLFVLWPRARAQEREILEDIERNFQIVARIEAEWPTGVDAESGYRRFYGVMLPDRIRKKKDSGEGRFLIVIVRDVCPDYGLSNAKRGLERTNRHMFDAKWRYRNLCGGRHCVHGTNSQAEARRDIMMLTGQSIGSWMDGTASGCGLNVLPGQRGWRSLDEVFALLEETCVYAILPNARGRSESATGMVGDEIELLVGHAAECRYLLNATREEGVYRVSVDGRDVHFRFRVLGDGFYDEAWERAMLRARRRTELGRWVLAEEDAFHALVYRVVYLDDEVRWPVVDQVRGLAQRLGVGGMSLSDWELALEDFMAHRQYRFPRPEADDVLFNENLLAWRQHASEFSSISGYEIYAPFFTTGVSRRATRFHNGQFLCGNGEEKVMVGYVERPGWQGEDARHEFSVLAMLAKTAPDCVAQPRYWHLGRGAAYVALDVEEGLTLRDFVDRGGIELERKVLRVAEGLVGLAEGLRRAGMVHRGLTPATVRIRTDGSVYVDEGVSMEFKDRYRKESPRLRNDFDGLANLGGEGTVKPGVWNDARALMWCAELLPRSEGVDAAVSRLESMSHDRDWTLRVRLPWKTVFRLLCRCLRDLPTLSTGSRRRRALLVAALGVNWPRRQVHGRGKFV